MKLSQHFNLHEFTRSQAAARLGLKNMPDAGQLNSIEALCWRILEPVRDDVGKPIKISSGYRSPQVNHAIGGSKRSQHCKGQAADIIVDGMTALELAKRIESLGLPFDQLIHEFGAWVHVSYAPARRGDLLTAYSSSGVTHYINGLKEV